MKQNQQPTNSTPNKNTFWRRLSWKLAPVVALAFLVGPVLIAVLAIQLTGAHLLDGLFGIYRNTPFQNSVVKSSIILVLSAPFLSLGFSIYFAGLRSDLSVWQRLLPLAIIIPILIIAISSIN